MSCPLTAAERDRLGQLEAVVDNGLDTFRRVGAALTEIRDARLYRQTHTTFEAYCAAKWGFGRAHAYRLIAAADVVSKLETAGLPVPQSEGQAREVLRAARLSDLRRRAMASLSPDEQQEVISGCEAEVIAGQKSAAQVGGEGRKERLAAVDRALRKAIKLAEGLGDEAAEGVNRIERARAWFAALPAE